MNRSIAIEQLLMALEAIESKRSGDAMENIRDVLGWLEAQDLAARTAGGKAT